MLLMQWCAISMFFVFIPSLQEAGPATPTTSGGYHVSGRFTVGGDGGWDYVIVDPATRRLFVPRATHVIVLSTETGKLLGDIPDTAGVHGVALSANGLGFSSNGRDESVTVFDAKTLAVKGKVKVGQNPDAIIFDPTADVVIALNGRSNDATVIDAAEPLKSATKTVALGGKPEFAVADETGAVWVNLEDKNEIVRFDPKAAKVTGRYPLTGGEEPSGLAIDSQHHHLFAGCGNKVMVVLDMQTGKVLATPAIGDGVDACAFDPATGEAFASCRDGTLTVVKETSPGKFEPTQTVKTMLGAKTMALDPTSHTVYLPTAEFGDPVPGQRRPPAKPGTFQILVVTK